MLHLEQSLSDIHLGSLLLFYPLEKEANKVTRVNVSVP